MTSHDLIGWLLGGAGATALGILGRVLRSRRSSRLPQAPRRPWFGTRAGRWTARVLTANKDVVIAGQLEDVATGRIARLSSALRDATAELAEQETERVRLEALLKACRTDLSRARNTQDSSPESAPESVTPSTSSVTARRPSRRLPAGRND